MAIDPLSRLPGGTPSVDHGETNRPSPNMDDAARFRQLLEEKRNPADVADDPAARFKVADRLRSESAGRRDADLFRQRLVEEQKQNGREPEGDRFSVAKNLGFLKETPESTAMVEDMKKTVTDVEISAKIKEGMQRDIVRENGDEVRRMDDQMKKKGR